MPAQLRQSFVRLERSRLFAARAACWLALALALACVTDVSAPDPPLTRQVTVLIESVDGGSGSVVSAPGGIDCPTTCSATIARSLQAPDIVLQATPAAGSIFLGWTGSCTGTGECRISFFDIAVPLVTARFGRAPVELQVTVTTLGQDASGNVESTPAGIICPVLGCTSTFPLGTQVTLTAMPSSETQFLGWTGACTGEQDQCVVVMDAAKAVTARFARLSGLLTVNVDGEGSGAVVSDPEAIDCPDDSCAARFLNGTSVTLAASPDPESQFVGWSGSCSGTEPCVLTMGPDASVTATFEPIPKPVLEVSVVSTPFSGGKVTSTPAGIDCPSDCEAEYEPGTVVTLTATPDPGSVFVGWSSACTGSGACVVTMDESKTVTAEFAPLPAKLQVTIDAAAGASGTVTSVPAGIACPDDCEEEFDFGTVVTLTATPAQGSAFAGWSGACTGTSACIVTMDAAKAVTATFQQIPHFALEVTIERVQDGNGSVVSDPPGIDCPTECADDFPLGISVTLTATPDEGSVFVGWSGACAGQGACVVTMDQSKAVTATFASTPKAELEVTISSAAGGTGHVTSVPIGIDCPGDCIAEFVVGTTVTLTATPLGGSNFLGWSGACTGTGACVVTMDAAKTVNASFLGVIGGGMLEVNIVDPARNPVVPSHAAIKRNGVWESLPVQSSYMLDVDHRFELAFRCGVGVRMYHGTIDEITMLRVECPTTLPSTTFSYSWNFDDIGFGTASTILNGPTGAFDFGSGSSNTKVVTGFPQFPRFDLLFVGRRTNLPVVYDIRRGLELPFTEPLNFNPPPFNAPEPQSLPPFMVPEGILSGFWEMQFATRRAFMSVGTGSSGGGVFRAVPSSLLQNGDKYVLLAGGTGMGGHSVSFAGVAAMQAAVGVQLPRRWSDFVAPQPSLTPVFLNLGFDEEDELPGVGFRFDISYPSGPKVNNFWHTFVTRAYLGSAQSYTFETPNLPGFIDIAIVSSDLVRFVTHRFSANRLMGVLLGVRLIGGTPAVDGLLLKTASVTGTFTAP